MMKKSNFMEENMQQNTDSVPAPRRGAPRRGWKLYGLLIILALLVLTISIALPVITKAEGEGTIFMPFIGKNYTHITPVLGDYVVLGWNDLGMHCYDRDYSTLSVLPPYNNLWAQVVRRGDPPEVITTGVIVEYSFPDNTESVSKTNFWDYEDKLFGIHLDPNVGLAGKGLAGEMDLAIDHFVADGIPITEFSDSAPTVPEYLQMALIQVKDTEGKVLVQSDVVAPISSEMRCDTCHNNPTQNFRMNILLKHDEENGTHLADQANSGNPVLCANCHADPALGMPGDPELPSLSAAMHSKHKEETSDCYSCHPGPETKCLRDVMSTEYNMTCVDCHKGGMEALGKEDRTPWKDEPRCADCHDAAYAENPGTLYRLSKGHGGLYCESCHNSTHAILKSRENQDNQQVISYQGYADTLQECTVCHLTRPSTGGPHQ
jgi:hypothetical protein